MNYLKIDKASISDGPGVRVVLWVSGCSIHCKGCQNPESWCFNAGKIFDKTAKQELFDALSKPYIQGITFSGGHPLEEQNRSEVLNLIQDIKSAFPDKDIWLYTGYTFKDICDIFCNERWYSLFDPSFKCSNWEKLEYVDILVDGPYIEEQRDITLKFRGSKNQRLIDVKETLKQGSIITIQN